MGRVRAVGRLTLPRWVRRVLEALLVAVVASLGTEALGRVGLLDRWDGWLSDGWHRLRGPRGAELPVVLVDIDDETLERVKDPLVFWGPHLASAVANLRDAGATVTGLDLLFLESAEGWFARHELADLPQSRTLDAGFRGQLYQGDVVLVATYDVGEGGWVNYSLPSVDYRAVLPGIRTHVALSDLALDADSVARRFRPVPVDVPDQPALAFGLALALRHAGASADGPWELGGREVPRSADLVEIAYEGPPRTFPSVPFWKVVEGALSDEEKALIRGRIALVGATYASSGDWFVTPYASSAQFGMRGHEVHANVASTLLSGRRITRPERSRPLLFALAALLVAVPTLLRTRAGAVAVTAGATGWPVLGYALFASADVVIPGASAVLAGFLGYGGALVAKLAVEEREKRFLGTQFGRYVSASLRDQLLADPSALGLGGAKREVTVLFSDIQGFTTISERLAPEEVVEMLNAWFGQVCRPILASGGEVNKFIGDAVMAVWGAPVPRADHAVTAVRAAIGMAAEVERFQAWMAQRFAGRDLPRFDIGIGVHTGEVVAGNIGTEQRVEFTVIGDTVNATARIEGLTRGLGCRILVSEQVVRAVGEGVKLGRRSEVAVKGRSQPVVVYELLGMED